MADWRNIRNGLEIPTVNYCDQPYVARLKNGQWLCSLTTAAGHEGAVGEFVGVTLSTDQGKTWSDLVPLEDPSGPESCYSLPFLAPSGRIYVFYNYNGDNFRGDRRSDELGWYVYRFSDDHGTTWSERHRLPMRLTECDRNNTFGGVVQLFWCVSHAVQVGSNFFIVFSKMKTYIQEDNEGWLFKSSNLLSESDPALIEWELLPEGDVGIRANAFGSVQEEHNIVPLSDGSLYCMYRTSTGHPAYSISRDGARTWSQPEIARYADGRAIKTPRACPMMWRCTNGKYLFWFHNNATTTWGCRNPVWLAGGVETDGAIAWSQPEILHYDPDEDLGMSYPDLIEEDGEYYFFHTQKKIARSVKADKHLLEALWSQAETDGVTRNGLCLELREKEINCATVALEWSPNFWQGQGLTIDFRLRLNSLQPGQIILDNRAVSGAGFAVAMATPGVIRMEVSDRNHGFFWDCDADLLEAGRAHSVAFIVDGGPKTISVVVDGMLCDGGETRPFGWGHFTPYAVATNAGTPRQATVNELGQVRLAPSLDGELLSLRIYDRYLLTSEVIANHRADRH
ncbi:MAG: exo-alpha-sialidase [Lentisphaeria bacterium]|nr:exo-alpha-sialidase [Lentisphaeria bacterium]